MFVPWEPRKFSVIYWALDMVLGFFTGFLVKGNLVQEPGLGCLRGRVQGLGFCNLGCLGFRVFDLGLRVEYHA